MIDALNASAASRTGTAAATTIILTSAACNAAFGYSVGSSTHAIFGIILAAGAIGGDVLKPLAVRRAFQLAVARAWGPAIATVLVAIACAAFSFTAAVGFASLTRSDQVGQREATVERSQRLKGRLSELKRHITALDQPRPVEALEALVEGVLNDPRAEGCKAINGPYTREHCGRVAQWRAEIATRRELVNLQSQHMNMEAELSSLSVVTQADPQAIALASYARALGFNIEPAQVGPWLVLVVVLFVEIGSAFGLVVAGVSVPVVPASEGPADRPQDDHGDASAVPMPVPPSPTTASLEALNDAPTERNEKALATLRKIAENGQLETTMQGLGDKLGVSKSEAHRIAHRLASEGALRLRTGARGSILELAMPNTNEIT